MILFACFMRPRFPDGQVDCRYVEGKVQVRFPQGFLKQIDADGTEHIQQYETQSFIN